MLNRLLPPKEEYVVIIMLSDIQIKLYDSYLNLISSKKSATRRGRLYSDFHFFLKICTHPRVLQMATQKEKARNVHDSEESLCDFTNNSDSESSPSDSCDMQDDGTVEETVEPENEQKANAWWKKFVNEDHLVNIKYSGKLVLLFSILREAERFGQKVVVFSQSIFSLDIIEYFLNRIDEAGITRKKDKTLNGFTGKWVQGLDNFRLDGHTSSDLRTAYCRSFNNSDNKRCRLFLISTRAGGQGINLCAANRVIIFDASLNPSNDAQSIYRVYRLGQENRCYIYWFFTHGTMEEKIYERQVAKLSLACRVVDEQQIERHYNMNDLQQLYNFSPEKSDRTTQLYPEDYVLRKILQKQGSWIDTIQEHNSIVKYYYDEEEEVEEEEEEKKKRKGISN